MSKRIDQELVVSGGVEMRSNLHFPRYDAQLNTDWCNARNNVEIKLALRLGFRQINPAKDADVGTYNDYGRPNGKPRAIIKWTPSTWWAWKQSFCLSAKTFWDGQFWILNTKGTFPKKSGQEIFIPNIWCKFDIIHSDANVGTHHHVIDVVRLAPSETWFGSHATLYDSADISLVQKKTDSHGKPILQRAHVHEVGHLLGLGHVDIGKPHCPPSSDTNASPCYGVADVDMNSVMGGGMRLDIRHAEPWLVALRAFTKAAGKSPLYVPPPKSVKPYGMSKRRLYPPNVAEFETGTVLTALPKGR